MKDWFDNLEARERIFVSIGGVVAISRHCLGPDLGAARPQPHIAAKRHGPATWERVPSLN